MERKYERLAGRYSKITIWIIVLILILVGTIYLFSQRPTSERVSVLIVSEPLLVASWTPKDNQFQVIEIPSAAQLNALHGYGRYSVASLWQLGRLEKLGGKILQDSIEELLAIPIDGYIAESDGTIPTVSPETTTYIHHILSLKTIVGIMQRSVESTTRLFQLWSFTRALGAARPDQVTIISLDSPRVLREEELPDGSRVKVFDTRGVDSVLGDTFENSDIRREAIRVSVFNTTQLPMLAEGAARFLVRSGVLVTAVGNDPAAVSECILVGRKEFLETITAQFISKLFDCRVEESDHESPTDLVVKIGTVWESRFTKSGPDR